MFTSPLASEHLITALCLVVVLRKSKESDHTSSETVEMEEPTEEEEEVAAECVKEETKETEVEEEIERVEEVAEQEATEAEKPEANISEKTPVLPLKKLLAAHHERKQSPKGGREKEVKIRGLGRLSYSV